MITKLFHNLRLRQRIMLPNLLAVLLLIALTVLFLFRFDGQERARSAVEHVGKLESSINAIMQDLLNIETGERGYLMSGDAAFLVPYRDGKKELYTDIAQAFSLTRGDVEMRKLLHTLEAQALHLLVTEFDPLVLRRQSTLASGDQPWLSSRVLSENAFVNSERQMDQIRQLRNHALDLLQVRLQHNEAIQQKRAENTMVIVVLLLLFATLLLLWVGWRTAQRVGESVESLIVGANAVVGGDLSYQLNSAVTSDELGTLAEALTRMRDHLAATVKRLEQKNWLAEQVAASGSQLESVIDQDELASRALAILDKQFDTVCAAFYARPLANGDTLQVVASRNCSADLAAVQSIESGVLARCRDDYRVYLLSPVPPSYLSVSSALGGSDPATVIVMPLAFENRLMAVIEMASFSEIDEDQLQLLQQLAERISGVLYGVRFTMRMEALLADADAARIELKEKADELERVSSYKSRFLASMSHEIRTPMNAILGMGELLKETPLTSEQREYLAILRSSGDGLLRIINDILDISKIEAGELQLELRPFDLLALVERTSEMMAVHAHEKGLELLLHVDDALAARLRGDEGRIQQVLINLLGNAIKFTESGEVSIHLHLQERFVSRDGVALCRLLIEVIDSGIGIPPQKLEMIFNAFTQADSSTTRQFGGTGLGLAISRQLVRKMDGELSVESREGEGSCFSFTMVLEVVGEELALPVPVVSTDGRVMMVVDGSDGCRAEIADQLSRWGVAVLQAANGAEALALLEQQGESVVVDLLLTNCDIDSGDGFALVEQVKRRFPGVANMLFMTTTARLIACKERAQQMGVELMLTKPICPSALFNLLLDLLQKSHGDGGAETAVIEGEVVASAGGSRPQMPKIKLLVAEDDRANQVLISHIMQRWDVDYTIVDNGERAVALVEQQRFDLLLMDINMPVMDGWEATKKIREHERREGREGELPIIALTALAFDEDERRSLAAGMDRFLTKPIRQEMLSAMVWSLVDEGRVTIHSADAALPLAHPVESPLFDRERALAINDGDEELLRMLMQTLHEELPLQIARLGQELAQGECEQLMRTAHQLKGAVATLGIEQMKEWALALERAAEGGDKEQCKKLFPQLERGAQQLRQELQQL
ncbi:MAG: response regulator [Mariprofundales bacterium]|nr:response regulator [Mariprofundales bacterium]